MKRFRMYRRANKVYYCEDTHNGKQGSLDTRNQHEAERLLHAKNEAQIQPGMNLQIARTYITASDPAAATRTWQQVMNVIVKDKVGSTKQRWLWAVKDKAFDSIHALPILETHAVHFLKVLSNGKPATNAYLRRLHNFALGMNWRPWPVIARKLWPSVRYKEKRAITWDEHCRIVDRERNPERRAFYQLAWHLGASQSDLANLHAQDIDWDNRVISFERMKTRWRGTQPPQVQFADEVERILRSLPQSGPLFPYLRTMRPGDRATEFKQRCVGLGIKGVSLQSYRYAWCERAIHIRNARLLQVTAESLDPWRVPENPLSFAGSVTQFSQRSGEVGMQRQTGILAVFRNRHPNADDGRCRSEFHIAPEQSCQLRPAQIRANCHEVN